jgi:outer membrane protein OmpA-like peptidoglycan-associated protein
MRSRLFIVACLVVLSVSCATTQEPAEPTPLMQVQVLSEPDPASVVYRGQDVGSTPLDLEVESFADLLEIDATSGGVVAIEKRVRVIGSDQAEVVFQFDAANAPMAAALGLERIMVFDYSDRTTFDVNEHELKPEFEPLVERQAEILTTAFEGLDVYVCGHTDASGTDEINNLLSVRRAESVAEALVARGVTEDRMTVQGFGKDYPLADNETDAGRALNRRTEIILPR